MLRFRAVLRHDMGDGCHGGWQPRNSRRPRMPVRSRSLIAGLSLALLTAGLLTACAAPVGPSDPTSTPTPASTGGGDDGDEQEVDAAWLDGGRMIGIVTQGSSTCIPVA